MLLGGDWFVVWWRWYGGKGRRGKEGMEMGDSTSYGGGEPLYLFLKKIKLCWDWKFVGYGQLFFRPNSDFGFACDSPMSGYLCEFIQSVRHVSPSIIPQLAFSPNARCLDGLGSLTPAWQFRWVKSEAIQRTCLGRAVGSFQVSAVAQVAT